MTPQELQQKVYSLIDDLRQTESRDALVYLTPNNQGTQKLFASWNDSVVYIPDELLEECCDSYPTDTKSQDKVWAWVWDNLVKVDYDRLARITGLSARQVECLVTILAGNKLIYPDGSVHQEGRIMVSAMAVAAARPSKGKKR